MKTLQTTQGLDMQTIDAFAASYDEISKVVGEVKKQLENLNSKYHSSPVSHSIDTLITDLQILQRNTPKEFVDDIVALADSSLSNGAGRIGIKAHEYYPQVNDQVQLSSFSPMDLWDKLVSQYGHSAEQIALHKTAQKIVRLMGLSFDDEIVKVNGMTSIDIHAYWSSDYQGGYEFGMDTCKEFNELANCLSIVAEKEDCEALTWIARDICLFFERGWSKKVMSRDGTSNSYFQLTVFKSNKINLKLCKDAFESLAGFISTHQGFMND